MSILQKAAIIISITLTFVGGYLLGGRRVEPGAATSLPTRPIITVIATPYPTGVIYNTPWGPNSTPYPPQNPYPPPR